MSAWTLAIIYFSAAALAAISLLWEQDHDRLKLEIKSLKEKLQEVAANDTTTVQDQLHAAACTWLAQNPGGHLQARISVKYNDDSKRETFVEMDEHL